MCRRFRAVSCRDRGRGFGHGRAWPVRSGCVPMSVRPWSRACDRVTMRHGVLRSGTARRQQLGAAMTVNITQVSVHGSGNEPSAGENLTAYAEVENGGSGNARVDLVFTVDGAEVGNASAELMAGSKQWVQAQIGQLAAGGHDLEAVGNIDDGSSSSQARNGLSIQIAGAAVGSTPVPTATLTPVHVRAHSNVEHPDGQAWAGERLGVWVQVTNTGEH